MQTVDEVWTIDVMEEIFVNVKSTPLDDDKVAQFIASLPVNVNATAVEFEVDEEAASVNVGGVASTTDGV